MYTAGGPLSQSVGDLVSGVTSVCQLYGPTETSQKPMLVPLAEDWAYMEFHPSLKLEMRPMGSEDGVCELVHHMDPTTENVAALNHNMPEATEYATRDLFMPYSTKSGLWRFHGRVDDVIVLSNGEKFFPVPMETARRDACRKVHSRVGAESSCRSKGVSKRICCCCDRHHGVVRNATCAKVDTKPLHHQSHLPRPRARFSTKAPAEHAFF